MGGSVSEEPSRQDYIKVPQQWKNLLVLYILDFAFLIVVGWFRDMGGRATQKGVKIMHTHTLENYLAI